MLYFRNVLFVFCLMFTAQAQAQEDQPFHAVEKLFSAISAYNYDAMYASATDDFQLLEDGEVWDMGTLVKNVRSVENQMERRNYFSIISIVDHGSSVWISYWNRANLRFKENGELKKDDVAWLESVVLVKKDNQWVIEMMHSTGIKGAVNIPENIKVKEYIGEHAFMLKE